MLFNPDAIENKNKYIDRILGSLDQLHKVLGRHLSDNYEIVQLNRVWNPGGGSTLFKVTTSENSYLLKVKYKRVWVESRLECEEDYSMKPSLLNEYEFLTMLPKDLVPEVLFYEENGDFSFLALEWLDTFKDATSSMTAPELFKAWEKINDFVFLLFSKGIVHTDIHEHNICFRDKTPVLIDFEEARFLKQELSFGSSLDYLGVNQYGNVGEFPSVDDGVKGLTCLKRLSLVFKSLILDRLPEFIEQCNFDDTCSFNLDELQKPDQRTYQSIVFPGLNIQGQRPVLDARVLIFQYLLLKQGTKKKAIRHLDIGSNLGMFCVKAAAFPFVEESMGVEAYGEFATLAQILSFLYDVKKTKYFKFICGSDRLISLSPRIDFITVLSVYHHISQKDEFLEDLKMLKPGLIMGEFATQDRYYHERGSLEKELQYIKEKTGYDNYEVIAVTQDYQRPIVIFSSKKVSLFDKIYIRLLNSKYNQYGLKMLSLYQKLFYGKG